jgi:hypothetical protein
MVRWWSVLCLGCMVALGCGRSVNRVDEDTAAARAGTGGATAGGAGGTGSGGTNRSGNGGSGSGGDGAAGTGASGGAGGTTMAGGSPGRTGGTGGVAGGNAGGGTGGDAGAAVVPECVIAVRLDECCSVPRPVPGAEFDANPCYREIVRGLLPGDSHCEPVPCPAIPCGQPPLPSRVVELLANGECGFVAECVTSVDCGLGLARTQCCSCAEAYPQVLLAEDSCLTPVGASSSKACANCTNVLCESCAESPPVGCLVQEGELNRCGFVVPFPGVAENQCVSEQPCVAATAPGTRCYAPSEEYCAGPAPPPDECKTDADCTASSFICEPGGHCGQKQCVDGCESSDDCASYEDCADDRRCVPRSCGLESDCGPTHACLTGICTRRSCADSSECGSSYCVEGQCYDEPGRCLDAFAP